MAEVSIPGYAIIATSCSGSDPCINTVSGTISDGQSITISGINFGAKSTAAPTLWDDFSDGTNGNTLSTANGWGVKTLGTTEAIYDSANARDGSALCVYQEVIPEGVSGASAPSFWYDNITSGGKILASFWMKYAYTGSGNFQIKPYRLRKSQGDYSIGDHSLPRFNWSGTPSYYCAMTYCGALLNPYQYESYSKTRLDPTEVSDGDIFGDYWFQVTLLLEDSSVVDAYDAQFYEYIMYNPTASKAYWIGESPYPETSELFCSRVSGASDYLTSILFQGYMENTDGGADIYYGDVYLDNTWARVEVGDNSDYDSCTHREMQIPSFWSNTAVSITLNQGSLASFSGKYLFVIDESNNASTGKLLT